MKQRIIKVGIVDDHPEIAYGVDVILSYEKDIKVIGKVHNKEDLYEWLESNEPDILLLDIRMPRPQDGLDACQHVVNQHPLTRVITYSGYESPFWMQQMLDAGSKGFLPKGSKPQIIANAIREVRNGRNYLPDYIVDKLRVQKQNKNSVAKLSSRELDLLKLLALGKNNTQAAQELNVADATVSAHLRNIRLKTGKTNIVEIINLAREAGIIDF